MRLLLCPALILAALSTGLMAEEFQCYKKSDCKKEKLDDDLGQAAGASEGAKAAVNVALPNGPVLVQIPEMVNNRKDKTPMLPTATVDYHSQCLPDGKTKALPAAPDAKDGSTPSSEKCATKQHKAFKLHVTVKWTDKNGAEQTVSKDVDPKGQDWFSTGEKCGLLTPADDKCHTKI